MHASIRRTDPATSAQVAADFHNLPIGRLTARNQAAHNFVPDLHDLDAWLTALGGHITRQRAGLGITIWTLHTATEPRSDGTRTTVLVHVPALTHELVDPHLIAAVA